MSAESATKLSCGGMGNGKMALSLPLITCDRWKDWLQEQESRRTGSASSPAAALRRAGPGPHQQQHSKLTPEVRVQVSHP